MKVASCFVACLLLVSCRIYDPRPIDCRIHCAADGACPADTTCFEGFCRTPGSTGRCECREGEEQACGMSQGSCRPGTQRCVGTEWGPCEGVIKPIDERCNGLDDDCDGLVDEEIPLPPVCRRRLGVCMDARQQCVGGAWQACEGNGPGFENLEVSCDGQDNDCDGLVDSLAPVQLSTSTTGPWFFLTTSSGFALVSGSQAIWLSRTLEAQVVVSLDAGSLLATSRGDTLVLATQSDAGVRIKSLERDGGVSDQLIESWREPAALELSVDVAAAIVNGVVQLVSLADGGAPTILGTDTDGTLKLSQTATTLAWSGGITRTNDLASLRSGSTGRLLALVELDSNILVGVPEAQPGAPVCSFDLLAGRSPEPVAPFSVPRLSKMQATQHQGQVLLVGIESPNRFWVLNERGTASRLLGSRLDSLRVTPSHEPMAAFAWEEGGTIWAVRRCAP